MDSLRPLLTLLNNHLKQVNEQPQPQNLYVPIDYLLGLGGKRLRPVLTLLAAQVYGKQVESALPAALAVELFHNFSLMHDDIMDDAYLRRGQATVHQKWNLNTAILSGDAMLILAYQKMEVYSGKLFKDLTQLFSKTAREVCEGQQMDMDFESRSDVTLEEYLEMIRLKTAVLVGCALQMGALVAGASNKDEQALYQFGVHLGIAFQLQDDYLDTFGDAASFGKQIGGDIIENKKTVLYHYCKAQASIEQQQSLHQWMQLQPQDPSEKIRAVKQLFSVTQADQHTLNQVKFYTEQAFEQLESTDLPSAAKSVFINFGTWLMHRST